MLAETPSPDFLMDLRFHDLRHEATSRLFERGVFDSMEVAAITGHKTLQMLKRYTHLRAEDLARKLVFFFFFLCPALFPEEINARH